MVQVVFPCYLVVVLQLSERGFDVGGGWWCLLMVFCYFSKIFELLGRLGHRDDGWKYYYRFSYWFRTFKATRSRFTWTWLFSSLNWNQLRGKGMFVLVIDQWFKVCDYVKVIQYGRRCDKILKIKVMPFDFRNYDFMIYCSEWFFNPFRSAGVIQKDNGFFTYIICCFFGVFRFYVSCWSKSNSVHSFVTFPTPFILLEYTNSLQRNNMNVVWVKNI